jgi:hypothetical protein
MITHIRAYVPSAKSMRRKGLLFCASCCDPFYAQGKFHAPVMIPVVDVGSKICPVCLNAVNPAMRDHDAYAARIALEKQVM